MSNKYFLVMEDINIVVSNNNPDEYDAFRVVIFKKGDIGEVVGNSSKHGYFLAKHLDLDAVHDIPYAPAFIKFVGDDLNTIRSLYEDDQEPDFEL